MTKVFISYSRKDKAIAGKLTEALEKSELETWIDWEDIPPTADWMEQIHTGIESADAFLFLLSPDSVHSEVCGKEIDHAVQNGKRLIPLVARDVNPGEVHPALAKVNWIYCREQDDFAGATGKLLSAIRTDLAWVEAHRRLQIKALEWNGRVDNSLLLRGKELREAEEKLSTAGQKDPQPTDLQRQFLLESRRGETRTRNVVIMLAVVVMILLAFASVIAVNRSNYAADQASTAVAEANARATAQVEAESARATAVEEANVRATAQVVAETEKRNAEKQAKISRAGELAAQSVSFRNSQLDLSLLLSVEAFYTVETLRTKSVLLENTQANPRLIRYLRQHTGPVNSVAYSPDGKLFASGGNDGFVILWDAATCQPVGQPLDGKTASVSSVAFSPDGKLLASSSKADKQVILWDVSTALNTGVVARQPIGESLPGNIAVFSPDGKMLAYGNIDGTIVLWDVATRQPTGQSLTGYPKGVVSLAFSPDGKTLASSGIRNGYISLWDLATRQLVGKIDPGGNYSDHNITFRPDGRVLASGGSDSAVVLSDVEKRQFMDPPLIGHVRSTAITGIAFSPDGYQLASASTDGTIILWNVGAGQPVDQPFVGHFDTVNSVAFSPDGTRLLSGGADGTLILWDVAGDYQPLIGQPFAGETNKVSALAFSPLDGGKTLAAGDCGQTDQWDFCLESAVTFLDMESGQSIGQWLTGQPYPVDSVTYSPNGKLLAIGYGVFTLWDVERRQPVGQPLTGFNLVFSSDGKTLAFSSAEEDAAIILWDLTTRQPIGQPLLAHASSIVDLVFSPDGKTLVSSGSDGTLLFWDLATCQPIGPPFTDYASSNSGPSLVFHPDGKTLAFISSDDSIVLLDVASRQVSGRLFREVGDSVAGLAFSPDGKLLASSKFYDRLILWDLTTRQMIGQPLKGFGKWIAHPFSPDGTALASLANDSLVFWDVVPQAWVEKICQRVSRNLTRAEWAEYFPGEGYRATCPRWPLELKSTPMP